MKGATLKITAEQANLFALARGGISRPFNDPLDAVRAMVAVQAQYAASVPLAVRARCPSAPFAWVDRAVAICKIPESARLDDGGTTNVDERKSPQYPEHLLFVGKHSCERKHVSRLSRSVRFAGQRPGGSHDNGMRFTARRNCELRLAASSAEPTTQACG